MDEFIDNKSPFYDYLLNIDHFLWQGLIGGAIENSHNKNTSKPIDFIDIEIYGLSIYFLSVIFKKLIAKFGIKEFWLAFLNDEW